MMHRDYVEMRKGGYYVAGSRVSLASIIYEYRDGAAPETIRQNPHVQEVYLGGPVISSTTASLEYERAS